MSKQVINTKVHPCRRCGKRDKLTMTTLLARSTGGISCECGNDTGPERAQGPAYVEAVAIQMWNLQNRTKDSVKAAAEIALNPVTEWPI